jgi:threonine synthase
MYQINKNIKYMECIKCHSTFSVMDFPYGCPHCFKIGKPASLSFSYGGLSFKLEDELHRYSEMLPYRTFPTLGEGRTPKALQAIVKSNGEVNVVPSNQAEKEQALLAKYGIYAERSSALVLAALKNLIASQKVNKDDSILMIISSNGYKELLS